MKIRPLGAKVFHTDGQTDMTELEVTFRSFTEVSKKRGGIRFKKCTPSNYWIWLEKQKAVCYNLLTQLASTRTARPNNTQFLVSIYRIEFLWSQPRAIHRPFRSLQFSVIHFDLNSQNWIRLQFCWPNSHFLFTWGGRQLVVSFIRSYYVLWLIDNV